jgi:4-hydroxy-tetrahydrodipicolinate synthase
MIHRRLLPLLSDLMTLGPNPIPVKYALNEMGFEMGGFRLPLCEPDAETGDKIMAAVHRQQIDLLATV